MNQLKAYQGGMPLTINDLTFMQSAYKDAIAGLISFAKAYGHNNFILSGCEVTASDAGSGNTQYASTSGFVLLNDEIYRVSSHTVTGPSSYHVYYAVEETLYGSKTFYDNTVHSVRAVREAKLVVSSNLPAAWARVDIGIRMLDTWHRVGSTTGLGTLFVSGWGDTEGDPLQFRKVGEQVLISGGILGGSVSNHITTLPEGYRPATTKYIVVMDNESTINMIYIYTDGRVVLRTQPVLDKFYMINTLI